MRMGRTGLSPSTATVEHQCFTLASPSLAGGTCGAVRAATCPTYTSTAGLALCTWAGSRVQYTRSTRAAKNGISHKQTANDQGPTDQHIRPYNQTYTTAPKHIHTHDCTHTTTQQSYQTSCVVVVLCSRMLGRSVVWSYVCGRMWVCVCVRAYVFGCVLVCVLGCVILCVCLIVCRLFCFAGLSRGGAPP
jgi:hypothetical protein